MGEFPIGITARSELVYRALLRGFRWRPADLAAVLAWPVEDVREVVDELRAEELVVPSADDPGAVRAVEPRLALPALTVRRLRAPCSALPAAVEVERFIALHERPTDRIQGGQPEGYDAINVLVERLVAAVKHEVVLLVPAYAPGLAEFSPHVAATVLRRAGTLRSVWSTGFLHLPPVVAHARWLGARGATPRTVERVPARVMIMDRTLAVVTEDGPHVRVVRTSPLLDSFCQLADRLWDRAAEVRAGRPLMHQPDHRPRSETVLQLLADGLTDDAIARRIGVSVRTVRADVATLMANLDARSRFQAGLRAAQLGLL